MQAHRSSVFNRGSETDPWRQEYAIYPLKGEAVALKLPHVPGARIRWYQIVPDISKTYKNAKPSMGTRPVPMDRVREDRLYEKRIKGFSGVLGDSGL